MTEHDIELARRAGFKEHRDGGLTHCGFYVTDELTKLIELIRAEKQGEAVARVIKVSESFFFDWLSMEAASKVRDGRHLLYTTPPDQSAKIARLREALQRLIKTKEHKERYGKDDAYNIMRLNAWTNAEQAIKENT
jgi:hypothetical protein